MKGLLWVLMLFALAVGVSLAAHFNEGYVLLVAPPYRVELSLNLAILLLLGGFLLFYGGMRAVALTRQLPRRVREFRERRQRDKTITTFNDAVRLLFEGRFSQAMKQAAAAHAAGQSPALAALLAARAAQRLREPEKMKEWLALTVQADARMHAASLMLEAEMQVEMRCFDAAIQTLGQLQRDAGRHIAALRLELRAQQGCGHWDQVLRLVRLLEKRNVLMPEVAQDIKQKAHQANILQCRTDIERLQAYQHALPGHENSALLVHELAAAMFELGACELAASSLEAQLEKSWDDTLVALYGRCPGGALPARIARAEMWLSAHGESAQLRLALGRMYLAQGLWDRAQAHLEAALALADQREVRLELARLHEQMQRNDEAMKHYRAAAGQDL
jgi:HemY protein